MRLYYTEDSDGHNIKRDAKINWVEGDDRDALLNAIESYLIWDEDDAEKVILKKGEFGDCWTSHHKPLDEDLRLDLESQAGELSISPPGAHPGGRAWWITPKEPIYVLIHHIKD